MRRQTVVRISAQTPAAPSKPLPLDQASLKKVVGGDGGVKSPHKGW